VDEMAVGWFRKVYEVPLFCDGVKIVKTIAGVAQSILGKKKMVLIKDRRWGTLRKSVWVVGL
jgi:hypothetical protein